MSEVIASSEMLALEQNAEYFGVSRLQLMENAGHGIALELASRFGPEKSILIFCGLGGNGGDGLVAARHLASMGFEVSVILAGKAEEISSKEALENWKALQFLKDTISIYQVYDSAMIPEITAEIIVDALLGTGTKGKLRPPILQLIQKINTMVGFKLAVDVPTGIDADTGKVLGKAVRANLTMTFYKTKKGLENAKDYVGKLIVKGIGLPGELEKLVGPGDVSLAIRPRPSESHKGDFGRLLIIGGSETFSGAPALVALAALRTGVDLAYIAAPEQTAHAVSAMSPDLITIKLEGKHLDPSNISGLKAYIKTVNAIVLGPGLGLHSETREAVKDLVDIIEGAGKPLLLDADALKAFAEFKGKLSVPLVLTPHAGEYAILTGKKLVGDLKQKISDVQKTAIELDAVVLLKGPIDIISDKKHFKLNLTGNSGMTVGGTGDVLSGIVGTFLAQGIEPFKAAAAGAFVNGAAGDFVFEEKGYHMVATDLISWIPHVLNDPMSHTQVQKTNGKED